MLEKAQNAHRALSKQLEAMCLAYWEFGSNNRELFQVMLGVELTSSFSNYLAPEFPLSRFKPVIGQLLKAKKKDPLASQEKYFQFFSLIHSYMRGNEYEGRGEYEQKQVTRTLKEEISRMINSI